MLIRGKFCIWSKPVQGNIPTPAPPLHSQPVFLIALFSLWFLSAAISGVLMSAFLKWRLTRAFRHARKHPYIPPHCAKCGYRMCNIPRAHRCPECGADVRVTGLEW